MGRVGRERLECGAGLIGAPKTEVIVRQRDGATRLGGERLEMRLGFRRTAADQIEKGQRSMDGGAVGVQRDRLFQGLFGRVLVTGRLLRVRQREASIGRVWRQLHRFAKRLVRRLSVATRKTDGAQRAPRGCI